MGFEVPPKNFPIPIGSGDYENLLTIFLTKTKEKILELIMDLKFENIVKKRSWSKLQSDGGRTVERKLR